jgi:DNA-directed RNA polymerase subunit M/transcription elongation factor TFIIS
MKRTMEERAHSVVHLDCEVCTESSVMLIPRQRASNGIVDCPRCGVTYLVSLDSWEEGSRPAAPRVSA